MTSLYVFRDKEAEFSRKGIPSMKGFWISVFGDFRDDLWAWCLLAYKLSAICTNLRS